MNYLLSIIVPTKNGYNYLKSIIKTFTNMDNGQVELVIQDNSDVNEEILQILSSHYSQNIKYFHFKQHLTVSDNFSKGIQNSSGLFVCMLGVDDTVSSKIVDIAQYMQKKDIDSAIFNKAKYYWPDIEFYSHKLPSLIIPKCTGKIKTISPEVELKRCLKKGATSLLKLPEIYQGIVRRTVLDKIYEKCNTYFPGASPDMAIAIPLSLVVKSHIYVDAPYTFSGQGYSSAGGKGARHQHKGRLKDLNWLPDDIEEKWEPKIPMIWTGATIYAESAHKALYSMGREDIINEFNYPYQYAWFFSFNPEYRDKLKPLLKGKHRIKSKIILYIASIFILRVRIYAKNILKTRFKMTRSITLENIPTSYEASKLVDDFIETQLPKL